MITNIPASSLPTRSPALKDSAAKAASATTDPMIAVLDSDRTMPARTRSVITPHIHRRPGAEVARSIRTPGSAITPTPPPYPISEPERQRSHPAGPFGREGRARDPSGAEHLFAVSRAPRRELMRAQPDLVCAGEGVGGRDHTEDDEELSQALLGSDQQISEEEERNPLELLAVPGGDLEGADGVRVQRHEQDDQHEAEHPWCERRQPHRLVLGELAQERADADRQDQHVAQRGDGVAAAGEQLDRAVQHPEVDREQQHRYLQAGRGHQVDEPERADHDSDQQRRVRVWHLDGDDEPERDGDQRRQPDLQPGAHAPAMDRRVGRTGGPDQLRL